MLKIRKESVNRRVLSGFFHTQGKKQFPKSIGIYSTYQKSN
jgi:hypothetical protein